MFFKNKRTLNYNKLFSENLAEGKQLFGVYELFIVGIVEYVVFELI